MGEKAVGSSVSLVSSAEERQQKAITDELGKHVFSPVQLDGRLLAEAQERVNLASKIVTCDEVESRSERSNKWFKDAAVDADLELDDDNGRDRFDFPTLLPDAADGVCVGGQRGPLAGRIVYL